MPFQHLWLYSCWTNKPCWFFKTSEHLNIYSFNGVSLVKVGPPVYLTNGRQVQAFVMKPVKTVLISSVPHGAELTQFTLKVTTAYLSFLKCMCNNILRMQRLEYSEMDKWLKTIPQSHWTAETLCLWTQPPFLCALLSCSVPACLI